MSSLQKRTKPKSKKQISQKWTNVHKLLLVLLLITPVSSGMILWNHQSSNFISIKFQRQTQSTQIKEPNSTLEIKHFKHDRNFKSNNTSPVISILSHLGWDGDQHLPIESICPIITLPYGHGLNTFFHWTFCINAPYRNRLKSIPWHSILLTP